MEDFQFDLFIEKQVKNKQLGLIGNSDSTSRSILVHNHNCPNRTTISSDYFLQKFPDQYQQQSKKSFFDNLNPKKFSEKTQKIVKIHQQTGKNDKLTLIKNWCKQKLRRLESSYVFMVVLKIIIVYSIIADNSRIIFFRKKCDWIFDILTIICIVLFSIELAMHLSSEKKYFKSFYFYLNTTALVFMLFDITIIQENLFYSTESYNRKTEILIYIAQIIKIVRIVRFLKFLQQHKVMNKTLEEDIKITKKLKNQNVKKIVTLILLFLITNPLFDSGFYIIDQNQKIKYKAKLLLIQLLQYPLQKDQILDGFNEKISQYDQSIIEVNIDGLYNRTIEAANLYRNQEIMIYSEKIQYKENTYNVYICQENRQIVRYNAILEIIRLIFIIVILVISIYKMNKDFSDLVLNPIERIIKKLKQVTKDPLEARKNFAATPILPNQQFNEVYVIEQSIHKISELLLLGLGQAGVQTISNYLFGPESDLDQDMHGVAVEGIFGFCNIKQFTIITEILKEEVMVFINTVAEMVHNIADQNGGAPNKNMGDSFMLVWKFNSKIESKRFFKKYPDKKQLSELSLFTFIDIIIQLRTDQVFDKYKRNKFIKDKIKNFQIEMGFGLHVGWAIEGAIGSNYKIDATYLSQDVNMAIILENLTRTYKQEILVTQQFQELLYSNELRSRCRHIDTILISGVRNPFKIYTFDICVKNLDTLSNNQNPLKIRKFSYNEHHPRIFSRFYSDDKVGQSTVYEKQKTHRVNLNNNSLQSKNFQKLFQQGKNYKEFRLNHRCGIDMYLEGNWNCAYKFLKNAAFLRPNDIPTQVVIKFLNKNRLKAPSDWEGYRKIDNQQFLQIISISYIIFELFVIDLQYYQYYFLIFQVFASIFYQPNCNFMNY